MDLASVTASDNATSTDMRPDQHEVHLFESSCPVHTGIETQCFTASLVCKVRVIAVSAKHSQGRTWARSEQCRVMNGPSASPGGVKLEKNLGGRAIA